MTTTSRNDINWVRYIALASAIAIGVAYAVVMDQWYGQSGFRVWHAGAMMVPHLAIVSLFSQDDPEGFEWGFASGVAKGATTGTLAFVLLIVAIPVSLIFLAFGLDVAALLLQLGTAVADTGFGRIPFLILVPLLAVLQFPLRAAARRGSSGMNGKRLDDGTLVGFLTVLIPVIVAGDTVRLHRAHKDLLRERAEAQAAKDAPRIAASTDSIRAVGRLVQPTLGMLHICVRKGCVDSLTADAARNGITIDYVPLGEGKYWATVGSGFTHDDRHYVTDETGVRLRWHRVGAPLPRRPDSTTFLPRDNYLSALWPMRECIVAYYTSTRGRPLPVHLEPGICGLHGDSTEIPVDNALHTIRYVPGNRTSDSTVADFSLRVRPSTYGATSFRSILVRFDGAVHVTTADREARPSDPRIHDCEVGGKETCHIAVPPRRK